MKKRRARRLQRQLVRIGWSALKVDGDIGPATRRVIQKFENGYAGPGPALPGDGRPTRAVRRAVKWSARNGGACSAHFRFAEFRSKGNGDIVVERALVLALERLRADVGRPIRIYSGYRDPYHNDVTVGGAKFSQHKYGCAADIRESDRVTIAQATRAGFTGIGYDRDNDFVEHVDVRHAGPNNTTGARVGHPTTWRYS